MGRLSRVLGIALAVCASTSSLVAPAPSAAASTVSYQETGIFGSEGIGDGQFEGIGGLAVDATGNVYVSDILNKRGPSPAGSSRT